MMTTRPVSRLLVLLVVVFGVLLAEHLRAAAEPFPGRCLGQLPEPVPLEVCFDEFLMSGVEDTAGWLAFLESVKPRLYLNQQTGQYRIHATPPAEVPYAYESPPGVDPSSETALVLRETRGHVEVPYLSSGGVINLLTLKPFLAGHSDVTDQILDEDLAFRREARMIVRAASQDPDFYDWKTDAAHAQTKANVSGQAALPHESAGHFIDWVVARLSSVKARCGEGRTSHALYWLGYALHAVQDLAAHNGRTSFEHSWNSYCHNPRCDDSGPSHKEGDPDEDVQNIERAREFTRQFLKLTRDAVGRRCWDTMKQYSGRAVGAVEKYEALKLRWDFTPQQAWAYKESRRVFAANRDADGFSVRWMPPVFDWSGVLARIRSTLK